MLDNGYILYKIMLKALEGGDEIMVKDYWIYQERQNETHQWAIYVVKETFKGKPQQTTLDFTIYTEDIPTPTNSITIEGLNYYRVTAYVNEIVNTLLEYTNVTNQDYEQLERSITQILQN